MNELAESKNQNLQNTFKNKLPIEQGKVYAMEITKLALAKNIKLLDGTLKVWEECLMQDLEKGLFTFEEFLQSVRKNIRRTAYNRLDYSELYSEAIRASYKNYSLGHKKVLCPSCKQEHLEVKALSGDVWGSAICGVEYQSIKVDKGVLSACAKYGEVCSEYHYLFPDNKGRIRII